MSEAKNHLDSTTVLRDSETICAELGKLVKAQGELLHRQQALTAAIGEVSTTILRASATTKAELEACIARRLKEEQDLRHALMTGFLRRLWRAICPAWLRRLLGRSEPLH